MKALFFLLAAATLQAQSPGNMLGRADESKRPHAIVSGQPSDLDAAVRRLVLHAARYPTRTVEGRKHDLTGFFESLRSLEKRPMSSEWKLIYGRVSQITKEGIIVWTKPLQGWESQERRVLLKNYYGEDSLADGDSVVGFALESGVHRFRDLADVTRSVRVYDCGRIDPAEASIHFELAALPVRSAASPIGVDRRAEAAQAMADGMRHRMEAARNGDGRAQYHLGLAYLRGEGVQTNLGLARFWLRKAGTNGFPEALEQIPVPAAKTAVEE